MGRPITPAITAAMGAVTYSIKLRAARKESGTAKTVPMVEASSAMKIVSMIRSMVMTLVLLRAIAPDSASVLTKSGSAIRRSTRITVACRAGSIGFSRLISVTCTP